MEQADIIVPILGPCQHRSPLPMSTMPDDGVGDFVCDDELVLSNVRFRAGTQPPSLGYERAGPRERIFFEPAKTRAAIVTCGGLCPGLNNVIRTIFFRAQVETTAFGRCWGYATATAG